jgi:hypothetical protein
LYQIKQKQIIMATKSGTRGRYICKVGFYDIYAKDSMKRNDKGKDIVGSTEYIIYHAKKVIEKGFKTKDLAVSKSLNLLGDKHRTIYNLNQI